MIRRRLSRPVSAVACGILLASASVLNPAAARADLARDLQWYLGPLGITKAHQLAQGKGVKVAVIDSGVDGSIPDLRGAVVAGKDFSGKGSSDGQKPIDRDDHGTNVASLLAGRGHGTGDGVLGSAPAASILTASFDGIAEDFDKQLVAALRWSVDSGASVINLSFGAGGEEAGPERDAYAYAQAHDVVLVAGSGNNGANQTDPPCSLPGVVCVGGIDKNLKHDPDSNTDPRVSIAAPYATKAGAQKTVTRRDDLPVAEPGISSTQYNGSVGTSLATAIVSGVAALIRDKFPNLDAANVVNRLIRTAIPAGSGRPNVQYGYGIVNAYRALTAEVTSVDRNPLGSLAPATSTSPSGTTPSSSTPSPTSPSSLPPATGTRDGTTSASASDDDDSTLPAVIAAVGGALVVIGLIFWLARRGRRRDNYPGHYPRHPT